MRRFYLVCILLLPAVSSIAQQDTIRKYLDDDFRFTTKNKAVYAAMIVKADNHWTLSAFYPDSSVLLKISYRDEKLSQRDGPFILYHPKKIPAQAGFFKDNIADGHWQAWYPSGQLKNDGNVISNHLTGVWKIWYENGQLMNERSYLYNDDATGQAVHQFSPVFSNDRVLDNFFSPEGKLEGAASAWYENGNKESVVNYHNDSLSGICAWFRENGKPSSKEVYTNGKVTDLECYDENGTYTGATCSLLKLPVFIHPFFTAQDYVINELHKEKHRDIKTEGEAQVSFTVTKKGTVEKLVIITSPDAALSKHIAQIFAQMPAWSPAVIHNRVLDYPMSLVIPYYGN